MSRAVNDGGGRCMPPSVIQQVGAPTAAWQHSLHSASLRWRTRHAAEGKRQLSVEEKRRRQACIVHSGSGRTLTG